MTEARNRATRGARGRAPRMGVPRLGALGAFLSVALATVLAPGSSRAQQAPFPTDGWSRATPGYRGLDAANLDQVVLAAREGRYGNVDRLVVVHAGYLLLDVDFELDYVEISRGVEGELGCGFGMCPSEWMHDFNYYHPLYHPYYQARPVHTLQSVTKSIAATVLAIALADADALDYAQPVLPHFESYDLSESDPGLSEVTLHHLLTMTSGIEWHEQDRPAGQGNTTIIVERSADWIQFTLNQPMDAEPGEKWAYNSGGSHLLAGITRAVSGSHMHEIAEEKLFGPLGIEEYYWKKTPTGYPDALGGLYLEARDLAKIGYLYLRDGMWDGERILPEGWVQRATTRHVEPVSPAGWGYGYQWWRLDRGGYDVWAGRGFGGQALLILPQLDVVAVVYAWNVFGPTPDVVFPFVDAIIAAAG